MRPGLLCARPARSLVRTGPTCAILPVSASAGQAYPTRNSGGDTGCPYHPPPNHTGGQKTGGMWDAITENQCCCCGCRDCCCCGWRRDSCSGCCSRNRRAPPVGPQAARPAMPASQVYTGFAFAKKNFGRRYRGAPEVSVQKMGDAITENQCRSSG